MEEAVRITNHPNVCRCCLIAIGTWDLTQQYEKTDSVDVFSDLLKECFGFALSHLNEDGYSQYVCDTCVGRLREASDFRQQVLAAELAFVQCINRMNHDELSLNTAAVVKIESDVIENDLDMVVEPDFGSDVVTDAQDFEKEDSNTISNKLLNSSPTKEKKRSSKLHKNMIKRTKRKIKHASEELKMEPVKLYLPEHETLEGEDNKIIISETKCKNKKAEIIESVETMKRNKQMFENRILYRCIRENTALVLKYSTIVPFRNLQFTNGKYTCQYCENNYIQIDDLKSHTEDHHAEITISEILSSLKSSVFRLAKAEISHIKCKLCGSDFKTLELLTEHLVNIHKKSYHDLNYKPSHGILGFIIDSKNPKCYICSKEFPFFQALVVHMSVHGSKNLKCDKCDKEFLTQSRLTVHNYRAHNHQTQTYKCKFCDEEFPKISLRQSHMKTKHRYGWLKCSECGDSFLDHKQRSRHMVKAHNYKAPEFTCSECPKVFTSASNLRAHIKTHGDNKIFQCKICEQKLTSKHSLTIHSRIHTGERPYACQFCERRFKSYTILEMHERGHMNDKRYVCEVCGSAFIQISSLRRHYRSQHPDSGMDLTKLRAKKVD